MPFTPLHMGPGIAVKAATPRRFSLVAFGLTQMALDLEVLWYLLRGDPPVHRFWHTFAGATLVTLVVTVLAKPISQGIKAVWNRIAASYRRVDLSIDARTTWGASLVGAAVGAYSHILLDSLYHLDVEPLQPWSAVNPLRGLVSNHSVEIACLALGVAGLTWFFWLVGRDIRKRIAASDL